MIVWTLTAEQKENSDEQTEESVAKAVQPGGRNAGQAGSEQSDQDGGESHETLKAGGGAS